jgi:hypothetical protein
MITAYHSTVLDHPVDRVWSLIRDFNNYPAYIDGVSASVIEDNKRGDEVGAVRRFKYGDNWIRQRLSEHSDAQRTLSYAGIELFAFPAGRTDDPPSPIRYEGTIRLLPIVDHNRTFIEWPVTLHAHAGRRAAVAGALPLMDTGMDGVVAARVGATVSARSVFASSLRATAKQSSSELEVLDCFVAIAPRNDG